jgi:glycine cleavage system H lipoate-binding protein
MQEVFGIMVATSNFPHRGHTWVALENAGRVRIGLDDFSQKLLGPTSKVKLPDVGEKIHSDEVVSTLSHQGKLAAVLSPLDGVIKAANPKVRRNPGLIHEDPYCDYWLFVVPPNLKPNLEKMFFGLCKVARMEHESHGLLGMLESTVGVTMSSGGKIIDDVYDAYPQLKWERLVREFLHTA